MANTPATPSPVPHPTRQQLDDLDALLERMLALPTSPEDETSGGPPDTPLPPRPSALQPPPGNVVLADPILAPLPPPPRRPEFSDPQPLPLVNPVPLEQRRAAILARPEPLTPPFLGTPRERPREPFVLLRPFLWCNRSYDRIALGLGAPGQWLRRPGGRNLVGLLGLMMIAVAVVLVVVDRIGWTW